MPQHRSKLPLSCLLVELKLDLPILLQELLNYFEHLWVILHILRCDVHEPLLCDLHAASPLLHLLPEGKSHSFDFAYYVFS